LILHFEGRKGEAGERQIRENGEGKKGTFEYSLLLSYRYAVALSIKALCLITNSVLNDAFDILSIRACLNEQKENNELF
jgi:hypothetical protein